MDKSLKRKIAAGAAAGLAVAGGGAAIAASQLGSPQAESQAIVNDAAQQLGIQPSKLSDALKKALEDRVDAAVSAGDLTKDEGTALKARIESDDFPLFGFPHRGFGGPGHVGVVVGGLDAAASYLGLTEDALRTQLESGKTLAQVAKDQGKSVDGLIQAMVDSAKSKLDAAVKAGRLTQSQEDSMLADLKQRITDLVNGKLPPFPGHDGFRFRGDRGFGDRFFGGRPDFRGSPPPLLPTA